MGGDEIWGRNRLIPTPTVKSAKAARGRGCENGARRGPDTLGGRDFGCFGNSFSGGYPVG